MTKRLLSLGWASMLTLASLGAHAQTPVVLTTSPYVENFDGLANGLPAGFGVYIGATATSVGVAPTAAQLILTPSAAVTSATPPLPAATSTAWNATAPGFKNFASNTGLSSTATADAQAAATDRALGVRQAGSFGDGTVSSTSAGPGPAFVFQVASTTGKTDFSLSFKLESLDASSPRTTTWRVDYGVGATPTAFTQVGSTSTTGPVFSNNTLTASFGGALDNLAGPVWIRIVAPTATTGSGNRPSSAIDDFTLSWNANANAPTIAVAPATLAFGNQAINTASAAQTYTLTGSNLTADATVTATAPFSVSKDNVTFGLTATYTAAELAAGSKPVYVKFTPTTTAVVSGPVTGTITNSSTGATSRSVTVTGAGTDPSQTVYSFSNCVSNTNLSDGWTQVSITGAQTWGCTTFGRDPNAPNGTAAYPTAVQINGYAGGMNNTNEDWLISPALSLASTTYPLLSYWTRSAFAGPQLRLLVSTNYSGSGSPLASGVTWTDLNAAFPASGSDTWTQTSNVDLSAYKMAGVYVAFVYNSTTDEGARWTLDDVVLTNSATPAPPSLRASVQSLGFGYRAVGTSTVQTMNVTANSLTSNLTVTSSNDAFQFSKDGTAFSSTLTYTPADISGKTLPVQVRFQPTVAATAYSATATIATTGATSQVVTLSGNTYDVANTLELVNWNMEWFGSSASGFGPDNKDLQYTNASTVLKGLNADVYALVEVVDTVRLNSLVASMPGYAYRVSDFGSNADNKVDPDYALTQKLAFVYRTSVVTNPKFSSFFRSRQADNAADYSYWSSGRFPFVMQADVTLNGVTKPVTFVAIHAKANTDPVLTSYTRRKNASDELKAKLDADYAGQNVAILGDFNDDLDQTITAGVSPATTSYSAFTSDATNYPSPTLQELSLTGKKSTVSYNDVIDHVVTSKSLYSYYLRGTAEVQTGITSTIANYGSTTSDHYPILTRYAFNSTLATKASRTAALGLYPNPVANSVRFDVPETGKDLSLQVFTTTGRLVLQGKGSVEQLNQQLNQRVGGLAAGLYVVRVIGAQQTYTDRFEKR